MNPSKTANPSRGEKVDHKNTDQTRKPPHNNAGGSAKNHPHKGEPLFGQVIVLPENKMFWHHNLFKQTRYWILKPQTHTHHHTKKTVCSLGVSVSICTFRLATRRASGCLLYMVVSIRATRSSSSVCPHRPRSERLLPFLAAWQPAQQYTHLRSPAKPLRPCPLPRLEEPREFGRESRLHPQQRRPTPRVRRVPENRCGRFRRLCRPCVE